MPSFRPYLDPACPLSLPSLPPSVPLSLLTSAVPELTPHRQEATPHCPPPAQTWLQVNRQTGRQTEREQGKRMLNERKAGSFQSWPATCNCHSMTKCCNTARLSTASMLQAGADSSTRLHHRHCCLRSSASRQLITRFLTWHIQLRCWLLCSRLWRGLHQAQREALLLSAGQPQAGDFTGQGPHGGKAVCALCRRRARVGTAAGCLNARQQACCMPSRDKCELRIRWGSKALADPCVH